MRKQNTQYMNGRLVSKETVDSLKSIECNK